jgi:protein SCO1/2
MHSFRALCVVCLGALLMSTAGCSRPPEYELRGQILAVDPARQELTIKHEDITGFMPGMTMPFKVRDARAMEGRQAGELIRATLVVEDTTGYLKNVTVTGRAPLTAPPPPPRVNVLQPGDAIPDTVLLDDAGRAHTLADWRGQILGVTFIYTRCPVPDFCPLMDRRFGEVQRIVAGDAGLRGKVHLFSVTFDPDHDTPAVLAVHAKKAGADAAIWSFLTGDRAGVTAFAAHFGVTVAAGPEGTKEIMHNLRTAVVDANGRVSTVLSGNDWTADALVAALRSAGAGR